ncbi:hypothetical protein OJ996_09070 [Luteolibacter sp. GHJ8]|uniref:Uncharacterized protein n=1 Tax=Luteolibacter rhizosphaerae TaxID=2989719 RepID=A0ABT3G2K1_9BACT|nr:hypothetical protein [Luteolibacter rhizosphaerae]MCW1913724.1 hypothetical protein [Luteolibacter rhizosphaerae]
MAEVLTAALAANAESSELAVTPLAPLGLTCDNPCTVLVKNTASGGPSWAVLYQGGKEDARIIYPPGPVIKVRAGAAAARVLINS